jgi:hypothetical protein
VEEYRGEYYGQHKMKQRYEDLEFCIMEKLGELGIRKGKGGWRNIMEKRGYYI